MEKRPKCKNCGSRFTPAYNNSLQKFCLKDDCVKAFVEYAKATEWLKTKKKMKEDLETVQSLIGKAQIVFNEYIRLRDKGKPCISCLNPTPKKINAGHFYNANNHWNVRFDEFNVHLQCEYCNTHLHGNLLEYKTNLKERIGKVELDLLEARS